MAVEGGASALRRRTCRPPEFLIMRTIAARSRGERAELIGWLILGIAALGAPGMLSGCAAVVGGAAGAGAGYLAGREAGEDEAEEEVEQHEDDNKDHDRP